MVDGSPSIADPYNRSICSGLGGKQEFLMAQIDRFFFERYGLAEADLERYLAAALSEGGDYADLYFEHTTSASILMDESLVKTATEGIEMGCGVRVLDGEQTGYAYTDDLEPEKILNAAKIAARIASGPARVSTVGLSTVVPPHNFYPVAHPSTDRDPAEKLAREAARQAIVQLDARDAPAGEMEVVLGPGWPGILLHEAVGHGLEADFNRKGISAFSGRTGQRVASELCTVVDDGTIPDRR